MTRSNTLTDLLQEQCMRYLLGELNAVESAEFEMKLQASPQLGDELLRQADVIAGIGSDAPQVNALQSIYVEDAINTRRNSRVLFGSLIAVAASVLLIAVFSQSTDPPENTNLLSEDLLIAKAWAAQRHQDTSDDLNLDFDEVAFSEPPSSLDNEDTLSWMFVAVAASSEDSDRSTSNDG